MTNLDKYKKEFLAACVRGMTFNDCTAFLDKAGIDKGICRAGQRNCDACSNKIAEWLLEEYKEPEPELLEDGDGLKPGDWIMVRSIGSPNWHKRQFMCFYDGKFYVADDKYGLEDSDYYTGWLQARLPMEGE